MVLLRGPNFIPHELGWCSTTAQTVTPCNTILGFLICLPKINTPHVTCTRVSTACPTIPDVGSGTSLPKSNRTSSTCKCTTDTWPTTAHTSTTKGEISKRTCTNWIFPRSIWKRKGVPNSITWHICAPWRRADSIAILGGIIVPRSSVIISCSGCVHTSRSTTETDLYSFWPLSQSFLFFEIMHN